MYIIKHLYVIQQEIDNKKHYYSHWEKLHKTSAVYGVVWNEYLGYACFFHVKADARKMLSRIDKYDPRTKGKIKPIEHKEMLKAQEIVKKFV